MSKKYKYLMETKEDCKFNKFLNKTIIGASHNYYKSVLDMEKINVELVEEKLLVKEKNSQDLLEDTDNIGLKRAIESLTKNERLVISFVFDEKLDRKDIANLLKIHPNTVSIIKTRAIGKLKRIILGGQAK